MKDLISITLQKLMQYRKHILTTLCLGIVMVISTCIVYSKMHKGIVIALGGETVKVSTLRDNVGDVIKEAGITVKKKDKIYPGLSSLVIDGMKISIKRAQPVEIKVDGKRLVIYTAENTVGELLNVEGIRLNNKDKINLSVDSRIKRNLKVRIVRVTEKQLISTKRIAYTVIRKMNPDLLRGKYKVLQPGKEGERLVTSRVVLEDGKVVLSKQLKSVVKKSPIAKIMSVGTLGWFKPSRGSRNVFYTKSIRMKATSYTASFKCTGKRPGDKGFGVTASGMRVRRNPNGYSTVAVDPSVIPLGSKIYVEGYGYAIAADTGGAVRGNIIDLYFDPSTHRGWSTHRVNVYILK